MPKHSLTRTSDVDELAVLVEGGGVSQGEQNTSGSDFVSMISTRALAGYMAHSGADCDKANRLYREGSCLRPREP